MISRFHYLTQDLPNFSHARLAEFACKGGANWIQLRVKGKPYNEWLKIAQEAKLVCMKYRAKLIINDNIEIAKEIGADGVHLGKEDMSPKEARNILGNNFIIGGTANSFEDVKMQIENKVDYIGLGPFRFTSTKEKLSPVLGAEGIKKIVQQVLSFGKDLEWASIPLIAIGGIKPEDIKSLMQAGIYGVAASSAINLSENKTAETKRFLASLGMTKATMPL